MRGKVHPQTTWDAIKTAYLTDGTTLRELGKTYGVDYTAICKRAKKENWQALKQCVQREADERTRHLVVETKVSNNELAVTMTSELLSTIHESIKSVNKKDHAAIKSLVASLKDLNEMGVFKVVDTESADIRVDMASAEEYSD